MPVYEMIYEEKVKALLRRGWTWDASWEDLNNETIDGLWKKDGQKLTLNEACRLEML